MGTAGAAALATAGFAAAPAAAPVSTLEDPSVASDATVPHAVAANAAHRVKISSRFMVGAPLGRPLKGLRKGMPPGDDPPEGCGHRTSGKHQECGGSG